MHNFKQLLLLRILPIIIALLGLGIAFAPQTLVPVCPIHDGHVMKCHWSAQAELGVGIVIFLHGFILLIIRKFGRAEGGFSVFTLALLSLAIPKFLIGGCNNPDMMCQARTFPVLYLLGFLTAIAGGLLLCLSNDEDAKEVNRD